jgi:hypothetical protein
LADEPSAEIRITDMADSDDALVSVDVPLLAGNGPLSDVVG